MKKLIAATFAAAVLATGAGPVLAGDDSETVVRRHSVERVASRTCDGHDCGVRVQRRGDGARHRFDNSHRRRHDARPSQFWPGKRHAYRHGPKPRPMVRPQHRRHRAWQKQQRRHMAWRNNQRRHYTRRNYRRHYGWSFWYRY